MGLFAFGALKTISAASPTTSDVPQANEGGIVSLIKPRQCNNHQSVIILHKCGVKGHGKWFDAESIASFQAIVEVVK